MFFFRRRDFCYDHMTSQPLFVHSFMQFQLKCVRDVIFRFDIDFTLIQRDKVKWVCVTLYPGAVNGHSKNLYRSLTKM